MKKIVKTLRVPSGMGWTQYNKQEKEAVCKLFDNPKNLFRYKGDGMSQCDLLEKEICELTGMKFALTVNSGTSALICGLIGLGIGPGDEVIIPGYTYIATATAVVNVGAVPVIAEIDESLSLDYDDVEKKITPYTKAIIPVHMQGVTCHMDKCMTLAEKHGLFVLEDSCQAVGGRFKGKFHGMISNGAAWSLNYFKTITSGEGGVFLTNDPKIFTRAAYTSDAGSPMWENQIYTDETLPPFTRCGFRAGEITSTVARVQVEKLMPMVTHTNNLKKLLISLLNEPINYKLQDYVDLDGDTGISFAMIINDEKTAKAMSELFIEVGLNVGSYNCDAGFPDRHIYKYWDSILTKTGHTDKGYPWKDPSYKGNVEYSPDMCPQLLDILGRTLRLSIGVMYKEQNIKEFAEAINFVDGII